MKSIVITLLSLFFGFSGFAQYYNELNGNFPEDSFYIKGLDQKLDTAISQSTEKILYLQDLQERFSKLEICKSLKLNLETTKLTKNAPSELYNERKKAVWVVNKLFNSKYDSAKIAVPTATAYSINNAGICISNFHVFADVFFPIRSQRTHRIQEDSSIYFLQNIEGKIYFVDSILAFDPINDITVFHINVKNEKMPFIPIAKDDKVGETVYIISHPDNNFYYMSNGIINRKYRYDVNYKIDGPFPKYLMDVSADYAIGSSGGPIMNEQGALVGMVSSTNIIKTGPGTQYQQQMVLKKSVPLEVIRKLLF